MWSHFQANFWSKHSVSLHPYDIPYSGTYLLMTGTLSVFKLQIFDGHGFVQLLRLQLLKDRHYAHWVPQPGHLYLGHPHLRLVCRGFNSECKPYTIMPRLYGQHGQEYIGAAEALA